LIDARDSPNNCCSSDKKVRRSVALFGGKNLEPNKTIQSFIADSKRFDIFAADK
jgi:hypothetical protein